MYMGKSAIKEGQYFRTAQLEFQSIRRVRCGIFCFSQSRIGENRMEICATDSRKQSDRKKEESGQL